MALLAQRKNVDYMLDRAAPEGHRDYQSCPLADFKLLLKATVHANSCHGPNSKEYSGPCTALSFFTVLGHVQCLFLQAVANSLHILFSLFSILFTMLELFKLHRLWETHNCDLEDLWLSIDFNIELHFV